MLVGCAKCLEPYGSADIVTNSILHLDLLLRFCLIRSYGSLRQPDLAAAAFDEMWRLGIWQPSDVRTANALLNALHADACKVFER